MTEPELDLSYNKYGKWVGKNPTQTPSKILFRQKLKQTIEYYKKVGNGYTKTTRYNLPSNG